MGESFPNWLSKQMVADVRGFNLDAYLVALEGWRRGLTLTWYSDAADVTDMKIIGFNPLGKTFSLSSGEKTHYFYRSQGDKVANEAVDIAHNKEFTKTHLSDAGVPNPKGKRFTSDVPEDEIVESVSSLNYPLVVKPTFGSLGKGLTTNIQTETELRKAIKNAREQYDYSDIIVERFFTGMDYRIYVVGDKVLAATKRIPANVIGDGVNTIQNLFKKKNERRKENAYLSWKQIEINQDLIHYINNESYTLESIPKKDEIVFLKGQSNISAGGDPIDKTEEITLEIEMIAVNAVKSIPGLAHAGVDVLMNDAGEATVIEINATSDISMHVFPLRGEPRNIASGIIDYYFPETKGMAVDGTKIYFDYQKINELQEKGLMKEIQITDAPAGELYAKRYVISGQVQKVGYRNWIRREARKQNLNGYIRNLRNGQVVVVVGGTDKDKVNRFKETCYKGPLRAKVKDIQEYIWDKQIKIGFEIREDNRKTRNSEAGGMNVGALEKKTVSLTAVGDILLHGRVYGGLNKKSAYNFSEQLANVKGVLGKTDITMANLESIIAGNEIGLSAFPKFNAPVEIGYTLKDMGVDIVTIANNHVLDRGEEGLLKSIENLEKIGLEYDGAYKSAEDKDRLRIIEKNGLKICFISYTRGTNGEKIPKGKEYLVNSLPKTSTLRISRKLREIKKEKLADVIIVNLHFGEEYHLNPSRAQKELAASLSDAGADVIIGHHPHVLQPPEWIENSRGTKTFVAYSLGNFFTGQNGLHRQIGASLSLDIIKPDDKYTGIIIQNPKLDLTFVNRESRLRYDMYLFRDWILNNEYIETGDGKFPSKKIYEDTQTRMRRRMKDLEVK